MTKNYLQLGCKKPAAQNVLLVRDIWNALPAIRIEWT
jgi:hypothetical protein